MFIQVHISIQFCRKRIRNVTNMWDVQCVKPIHIANNVLFLSLFTIFTARKININECWLLSTCTILCDSDYTLFSLSNTKNILKNSYTSHERFSFSYFLFSVKLRKIWLSRYETRCKPVSTQSINLKYISKEIWKFPKKMEIVENRSRGKN